MREWKFIVRGKKKFQLRLSGSDISTSVIENDRKQYDDIKFSSFDIGEEIFHSDRYDIITCCEVLEHVANAETVLRNLKKMLKPNGVAILTIPGGNIHPIDKLVGHYRHFSDSSLFDEIFEVKEFMKWGFPFFNLYKWAINLRPEKTLKEFNSSRYGLSKRLISNLINFLFFFNLPVWGNQIVVVLKQRT